MADDLLAMLAVVREGDAPLLRAGRCERCGAYSVPRRDHCARCGPGPAVATGALPGEGRIYASTVVHVPSPAGLTPPYAYGYVDLAAAPVRVFALFARADRAGVAPGTDVRLTLEPLAGDETPLVPKFTAVP